eukprot:5914861-Prymnesium_polylepis.1
MACACSLRSTRRRAASTQRAAPSRSRCSRGGCSGWPSTQVRARCLEGARARKRHSGKQRARRSRCIGWRCPYGGCV